MSLYLWLGQKSAAVPGDGKAMKLIKPQTYGGKSLLDSAGSASGMTALPKPKTPTLDAPRLMPSYVKERKGTFVDKPVYGGAPKAVPSVADMVRDAPGLAGPAAQPAAPVAGVGAPQASTAAPSSGGLGNWAAETAINTGITSGAPWALGKAAPYLGLSTAPAAAGASVMGVPALAVPAATAYGGYAVGDAALTAFNLATGRGGDDYSLKNRDYTQMQDGGGGSLANYAGMAGWNLARPGMATAQAVNGLADLSGIKSLWGGSGGVIGENFRARGLRQDGLKGGQSAHRQDLVNLQSRLDKGEITQQQYEAQKQRIAEASQRLQNSWW